MIMYFWVYFDIITMAELYTALAFHTISYGNDDVEMVNCCCYLLYIPLSTTIFLG